MTLLAFLGGIVLLVVGADLLVRGASRLSLSIGLSPLIVGLTVVAVVLALCGRSLITVALGGSVAVLVVELALGLG